MPHRKDSDLLRRVCRSPGVELLRQATLYAQDAGRQIWEFAVEIDALIAGGLSVNDLRWLIARGYAEHADETTRLTHRTRRFRLIRPLIFTRRACLALTKLGFATITTALCRMHADKPEHGQHGVPGGQAAAVAPMAPAAGMPGGRSDDDFRGIAGNAVVEPPGGVSSAASAGQPLSRGSKTRAKTPSWDAALHELRFGRTVVKRFRRPARTQELILAAFEEEKWPEVIDDPLPVDPAQNPKRRLHYTVHHLNRVQRPRLIHFYVNGNGQSVYWQAARDRRAKGVKRARHQQ